MSSKRNILFLVPYPLHRAPSQRFRVELFLPILEKHNIHFTIKSFLDETTWKVLYQSGSPLQKAWGVVRGFLRRTKDVLFVVPKYEYIFIHREASPIGPPVFEFIISKIMRKKIIYDFDDAIWIPNTTHENRFISWFKAFWKTKYICKWSYKVVAGNQFLSNFAKQHNPQVVLIPTCVDTIKQHNRLKNQYAEKIVIGWTGSHSTMKFLDSILGVLNKLVEDYNIEVVIISNKAPEFDMKNLIYLPWNEATEVEDLLKMNIGIMPLETDPWCEGKCGFKLIQYLSLGIPAVASPIGVNKQIIDQDENGFLCTTEDEWYNAIATLIQQENLRSKMGKVGKEKVQAVYSIQANAGSFLALFS